MVEHLVSLEGAEVGFPCGAGDRVRRAALRAGLGLAYECNSGSCGSCRYQLVSGEVRNRRPGAPGLTARDRRRGRRLACQDEPVSACTVRAATTGGPVGHRPGRHRAELQVVHQLTHDMAEFVFLTDHPARFRPGQYAMLELPGVTGERAYSMCNLANPCGEWRFVIKRVPGGAATEVLFDKLNPGDRIALDGPFGHAFLREDDHRIVCVAGGSGLGAMLGVVSGLAALPRPLSRSAHVFYGGRTGRDLCRLPVLDRVADRLGELRFTPVVSEPDAPVPPGLRTGYVHDAVAAELGNDLGGRTFYAAGPPVMTEALARLLVLDSGVPADRLHYDRFL
ncbi:MAG: FAD-binding oxidoreductase [Pseudonocardia sp.]